jgi:hypothetical protein
VKDDHVDAFELHIKSAYLTETGKEAYSYPVETSEGAAAVPF